MSHEHGRVCAWRARNKKESLISAIVHHTADDDVSQMNWVYLVGVSFFAKPD